MTLRESATSRPKGISREMGLGSFSAVTLEEARELAADCRRSRSRGVDPIEARRKSRQAAALESARALTFKDAATAYISGQRDGWKNGKHVAQWGRTRCKHMRFQ